jgi:hypothetical protein
MMHHRHAATIEPTTSNIAIGSGTSDSTGSGGTKRRKKQRPRYGATGHLVTLCLGCIGAFTLLTLFAAVIYRLTRKQQQQHEHSTPRWAVKVRPEEFEPKKHPLAFNSIYRIPDSMDIVGDRSDRYAKLRMEVDPQLPENATRSLQRVKELHSHAYASVKILPTHSDQVAYGTCVGDSLCVFLVL